MILRGSWNSKDLFNSTLWFQFLPAVTSFQTLHLFRWRRFSKPPLWGLRLGLMKSTPPPLFRLNVTFCILLEVWYIYSYAPSSQQPQERGVVTSQISRSVDSKRKSWLPLEEYPRYILPTYTTFFVHYTMVVNGKVSLWLRLPPLDLLCGCFRAFLCPSSFSTLFLRVPWRSNLSTYTLEVKVADLSPRHFRKQSATDGTKLDINIGDTRVWRLGFFGPNLQPWKSIKDY